MTTREMIEVMEAFERGEVIEAEIRGTGMYEECVTPDWNWDYMIYRIKPKEEEKIKTKFKKGDEIVHKELCNGAPLNKDNDFLIIEDINLSENKYEVYDKKIDTFEFFDIKKIDENYINADDCLWYWEYCNNNYKAFAKTAVRYNKEECIDYLQKVTSDLTPTPIYQLGARLPKERE
ncbi:hypothetical protein YZ82_08285 [Campylobacter hyointestinalis]|uniref:Uncharacterized protein n=1 Tax=Campylobacter hyointestinalis TaxID=198 RepID=A0A562X8I2_CAMHY|nr:hypothetical protein [Campylobacter hyointestinalis]TWO17996.1 hypothetical protein YZ82_08285 [Campylobacter hyointestinalis]